MNKKVVFTADEKLSIIKEAEEFGVADTMRKYDIPITTYKQWLKKYEMDGFEGLDPNFKPFSNPQFKQLKQEQVKMKKLVSELLDVISRQDELIKELSSRK